MKESRKIFDMKGETRKINLSTKRSSLYTFVMIAEGERQLKIKRKRYKYRKINKI